MSAHRNGPPIKRVCIDENLPRPIALHLGQIWPRTRFDHVVDLGLRGTKDVDLAAALGEMRFDAILTQDFHMLFRREEAAALAESGLSWIGIPVASGLRGRAGLSYLIATAVAGFPIVTSAWHGAPAAYDLRPAPYAAAHLRVRALADIVSGIAVE